MREGNIWKAGRVGGKTDKAKVEGKSMGDHAARRDHRNLITDSQGGVRIFDKKHDKKNNL